MLPFTLPMVLTALLACTGKQPTGDDSAVETPGPHNVLLLVSDDIGVEISACYPDQGVARAPQPRLQRLCAQGVAFDHAWSAPVSSPTRAGMLTGREGWRTGVGEAQDDDVLTALDAGERSLPAALALGGAPHASGMVGKWHLGSDPASPNLAGWLHFAGALLGEVPDYYAWDEVVDGTTTPVSTYATTRTVDQALSFIQGQQDTPWVLWVAFNAPHTPLHLPPTSLQGYDDLSGTEDDITARPARYYQAMVQAMDSEIGRLLDGIDPSVMANTDIIYLGDNGTAGLVNQGFVPNDHAKASLYAGGVHVPLFVTGPDVVDPGRRVDAPVESLDLFATILDLAGADRAAATTGLDLDAASLLPYLQDPQAAPQRSTVLAEIFGPRTDADHQGRAMSDGHYKLLSVQARGEELYDLQEDPLEQHDLLVAGALSEEAQVAHDALQGALAALPALPAE